jgi:hypothetical protein
MVTTGSEDAWQRKAYISVESSATVKMQYEAMTETIDIDMSERDIDKIDLLNLGQITKHGQPGICTITFEGYPLYAGTSDTSGATRGTPKGGLATGFWEFFANAGHSDTAQPLDLDMSNTLTKYRVAILWTDDVDLTGTLSAASNATPSVTAGATTANDHAGKIMRITSGTGIGGYYMIVSHSAVSVYTLTSGDTPATDLGSTTPNNTITIYPTGSGAVPTSATKGKRFVIADCHCTSCKTSMTDGILKQTIVFKGKCFDKTGNPLIKEESTSGGQIPALGNYTAGTTYWA